MNTAYAKNVEFHDTVTKEHDHVLTVKTILSILYIAIPIAAGLDKFFNILVDWEKYLNPFVTNITGLSAPVFMISVGIIEIAAGIIVFMNRKIGAYIVSIWLLSIAFQLIISWMYLDVAVRDIAMAAGAFCLGLLSEKK